LAGPDAIVFAANMKRTSWFAVVLFVGCCALFAAQNSADSAQAPTPRLGSEVVWDPSPQILSAIGEKCAKGDPADMNDCFLDQMRAAGASLQAVEFAKSNSDKGLIFVRAFRKAGVVDIAYIDYPFRANELDGVLLVNGDPSIIDVDSQKFVARENFSKNPTYSALAKKYPEISMWPGDRFHTNNPLVQHSESGQQLFEVDYIFRDGCHACAQIGTVRLIFAFGKDGKFNGVQSGQSVSSTK
jgi:hypothetical protein